MKTIVSASPKDTKLLASLEIRSESYWGYRTYVYWKRIWQNIVESCF
jgi:hypothetical protein